MTITIVSKWDTGQLPNEYEWNLWRQIKGAFAAQPADIQFCFCPVSEDPALTGVSFQQYNTMEECLSNVSGKKVFFESGGSDTISSIPTDQDVVLIFGNTPSDNLSYIGDDDLHITLAHNNTGSYMYSANAAAVVLACMHGQS